MTEAMDMDEMNRNVITEFRANEGRVGGMFDGVPLVLLHHTGAKSGTERVTPLGAYHADDRIYIFASKAGAPTHPAWYHNLLANPETTVEFGNETFPVVARVLAGAERDDIYGKVSALLPQFAEYQRMTDRIIPVIELARAGA